MRGFSGFDEDKSAKEKLEGKGKSTNNIPRLKNWKPKVTTIMELKDLDSMALATLFGKLQEHEIELGGLKRFQRKETKKSTFKGKTPKECFTCHEYGK
ncbi:hypothetical protein Lal_00033713 [Lupinus albus]|nr:hypothetical protein Lal_00033713 [Lupinus albus]